MSATYPLCKGVYDDLGLDNAQRRRRHKTNPLRLNDGKDVFVSRRTENPLRHDRIYPAQNKSNKTTRPRIYPTSAKWPSSLQWSSACESLLKKGDGPRSTRHNSGRREPRLERRSEEICFAGTSARRASRLSKTAICTSLSICAAASCPLQISSFCFLHIDHPECCPYSAFAKESEQT